MLGEPENQFSLTRAALSTLGAQKQVPISSILAVFAATGLGVVAAAGATLESRLGTSLAPVAVGGQQVFVESQRLAGRVLDNLANKGRQGSGFNPLCYERYPGKSIYSTKDTGLNFEHIFNGAAADKAISMFTPRKDPVELIQRSRDSVSLHWPSEHSAWGMDCRLTYTLADRDSIDIAFSVTPTRDRFERGYVTLMWASYLACARDRRIYFYGMDKDREGWITFGEDIDGGFETGTVSCQGVKPLPNPHLRRMGADPACACLSAIGTRLCTWPSGTIRRPGHLRTACRGSRRSAGKGISGIVPARGNEPGRAILPVASAAPTRPPYIALFLGFLA
jgi:hypothetical protein